MINQDPTNPVPICFSGYNYSPHDINNIVTLYVKKTYPSDANSSLIFNKREIKRYLFALKQVGFKFYLKEGNNEYIITLKESDYINKTHVRTALDYVRFLWEDNINLIAQAYLKLPKKLKKQYNVFLLCQVIQKILKREGKLKYGHTLCSTNESFNIITLEQFNNFLKANPKDYNGSSSLWYKIGLDKTIEKFKTNDLEKELNTLLEAKRI